MDPLLLSGVTDSPPSPAADRSRDAVLTPDVALRELMAVREIAHALLSSDRAEQVFQVALERVTPLVGAAFASVYLLGDPADPLMRLAAAHNWPARYQPWLGEMRVRVGSGPSGRAAAERRPVEVPDVFADASLGDWQEVARELGVRALAALPLQTPRGVLGALTFYFEHAGGFTADQRGLLRIVADQMAAAAERAGLVSELTEANARLSEANVALERQFADVLEAKRVKDEFLANISHELRTPLTAVMGYVGLLAEGASGPLTGEQRSDLAQVQNASDELLALIDRLLDLTALRRGVVAPTMCEFDPREAAERAVEAAGPPPSGVRLRLTLQPDAPPMHSDPDRVRLILVSLLSNAFKFTGEGEVELRLETRRDRVRYQVRDSGPGVPEAARAFVFDEFRQADGSSTRRHGGAGVGLSIARGTARLLGGELRLDPAPPPGAIFTVDLPLVAPAFDLHPS